jgi:hypothetical protein
MIKNVAVGWFCFCYFFSLLLLPVFPFFTTGFDWRIALVIIFVCPLLFLLQGFIIGVMVLVGQRIYQMALRLLSKTGA